MSWASKTFRDARAASCQHQPENWWCPRCARVLRSPTFGDMTRQQWLVVGAIALMTGVAGCSHAEADSSGTAVPAAFAAKAVTVCKAAADRKAAAPAWPYPSFNPTKPDWKRYPGVARALEPYPALFRSWEQDMKALG